MPDRRDTTPPEGPALRQVIAGNASASMERIHWAVLPVAGRGWGHNTVTDTFDLLPVGWGLSVPQRIADALVDMGTACNEAAIALDGAYLERRRSLNASQSADACGGKARYREYFARQWSDCTLSYTDQLTAVYTAAAGTFAAYAAAVGMALTTGSELPSADPEPLRPSRLLGEPEVYLPLVQLPVNALPDGERLVAHNNDLASKHRYLVDTMRITLRSQPVDVYDDPARLAVRSVQSIELHLSLAHALHGYAATCAWGVGLVTRH